MDLTECFAALGTWNALLREVDFECYEQGVVAWEEAQAEEKRRAEVARLAILAPHQARWQRMRTALEAGALYCPHCREEHANIRSYDRHPDRKSIFICQVCAFSFDPDGLPGWHKASCCQD